MHSYRDTEDSSKRHAGPDHRDPRVSQIAILGSLLVFGLAVLDLDIDPAFVVVLLSTALLTQWLCSHLWQLPRFDPKSALISGLSLSLLARTDSFRLAAIVAVVTIASKFVIRAQGKHVFNPTNFGLVVMIAVTDGMWVSPGQWGSHAFFGLLLASLGAVVVHRASRSDVTVAFLTAYAVLLLGRALWLGDPLAIPLHQLQSGALLIFAFLMISDPKTTPNSRSGRIVYASLVAALSVFIQFGLYSTNALLWSLALCAPLTPIIDLLLPGRRYRWRRALSDEPDVETWNGARVGSADNQQRSVPCVSTSA